MLVYKAMLQGLSVVCFIWQLHCLVFKQSSWSRKGQCYGTGVFCQHGSGFQSSSTLGPLLRWGTGKCWWSEYLDLYLAWNVIGKIFLMIWLLYIWIIISFSYVAVTWYGWRTDPMWSVLVCCEEVKPSYSKSFTAWCVALSPPSDNHLLISFVQCTSIFWFLTGCDSWVLKLLWISYFSVNTCEI